MPEDEVLTPEILPPRGVPTNGEVAKQNSVELRELGATGLKRSGGMIDEEWLSELRGDKGVRVFQEMRDNDEIVGGTLFAIEYVMRSQTWRAVPGGSTPQDAEAADFLGSNMDDMNVSWAEFIAELLSFVPFGWSFHEVVPKRRNGPQPPRGRVPSSIFDDGRIGVRKLPIRAQESLDEWIFDDETGAIRGMRQRPAPDFSLRSIPIEKALLFRTTTAKGNPEGRSALRNAYRPWYFKRSIQEIEAVGIERDLAGFPVAGIPAKFFKVSATPAEKATVDEWVRTMRDMRLDSLQGLVKPNEFDANGNNLYTLELLTTGGSRQMNTSEVIARYNVGIASVVLADFILLGHEKVGSFALASQKSDLFSVAVNGWLMGIAEVLNRHLVPRLFRWNDFRLDRLPTLQPTPLERVDLKELGDYITALSGVGEDLFPNEALTAALLQVANLPEPTEEERQEQMEEPEPEPEPPPMVVVPTGDEEEE